MKATIIKELSLNGTSIPSEDFTISIQPGYNHSDDNLSYLTTITFNTIATVTTDKNHAIEKLDIHLLDTDGNTYFIKQAQLQEWELIYTSGEPKGKCAYSVYTETFPFPPTTI